MDGVNVSNVISRKDRLVGPVSFLKVVGTFEVEFEAVVHS